MADKTSTTDGAHWERHVLQKVLLENIAEQRRTRRWGIFFKLIFIVIIGLIFYRVMRDELPQPVATSQAHTAMIDIRGEITPDQDANADSIIGSLQSAYSNKNVKGVILRINSPGGSPVQARQIFNEIMMLRAESPNIKIYAAIEELGTSAAYLVASAVDAIYADETSLVGSIGVKIDSFGFVDAMQKVGVERRLYTAGVHKGAFDPFLPRVPADDAFLETQLKLVHQAFIKNVREGRGNRLKDNPEIFSGLFWCGEDALKLGLIDGYGDAQYIASEIIKADNIVDYSPTSSLIDRLANRLGASIAHYMTKMHFH